MAYNLRCNHEDPFVYLCRNCGGFFSVCCEVCNDCSDGGEPYNTPPNCCTCGDKEADPVRESEFNDLAPGCAHRNVETFFCGACGGLVEKYCEDCGTLLKTEQDAPFWCTCAPDEPPDQQPSPIVPT